MTDRIAGYIVTLEKDIREDDAEKITIALKMVKGVIDVQPLVSDPTLAMAVSRSRNDLMNKIFDVFHKDYE